MKNVTKKEFTSNVVAAKAEVRNAQSNIMYWVNQLNKLARKNEFCDGVNIRALGKLVRAKVVDAGHDVKDLFSAYLFTRGIDGRAGYTYTHRVLAGQRYAISEKITDWRPVTLSLSGLITAYQRILAPEIFAADTAAKDAARAAAKIEKARAAKVRAARAKEIRHEQLQARAAYASGEMSVTEFAAVMAKVA